MYNGSRPMPVGMATHGINSCVLSSAVRPLSLCSRLTGHVRLLPPLWGAAEWRHLANKVKTNYEMKQHRAQTATKHDAISSAVHAIDIIICVSAAVTRVCGLHGKCITYLHG